MKVRFLEGNSIKLDKTFQTADDFHQTITGATIYANGLLQSVDCTAKSLLCSEFLITLMGLQLLQDDSNTTVINITIAVNSRFAYFRS